MKNIFEDIKKEVACNDTQELLNKKEEVKKALEQIQFTDYSSEEIKEFYQFMFCQHCRKGGNI